MLSRTLSPLIKHSKKSVLLLGPRQTGKSTLIQSLEPDLSINFAHESTFLEFSRNPLELEQRLDSPKLPKNCSVFIDEVQRLPSVLNTVQTLLDDKGRKLKFYLTGSSARKLKRHDVNLLPGRIHTYNLGPLTSREAAGNIDIKSVLATGMLPGIFTESDDAERKKTLRSYAATYLREEIKAESLTNNLEGFARFLDVVAAWSGHFLDLSKMAASAQVARQSAVRWFEVMEDTLILRRIQPFSGSSFPRLVQHPKFHFFDIGVLNGLLGNFDVSADRIGALFEHFIVSQLWALAHASDHEIKLSTFRTEHGAEVDLIVEIRGRLYAVELKASTNVGISDLRGVKRFLELHKGKVTPLLLYLGRVSKRIDKIDVLPWQEGLQEMGF